MKKLLAILVAAMMLFGIFGGVLAKPAAYKPATGEKTEAKVIDPLIEKKTCKAMRDGTATLDEALNAAGGAIAFVSEGTYPWTVLTDSETGRVYAQSSNAGVNSSSSIVSATVEVGSNKAVKFEFKAWGEGGSSPYDKCIFAIDGNARFTYGARDNDWEEFVGNIGPGTHTLTWEYSKDSSVHPSGDYFAVDNIEIVEREAAPINTEITEAINVEGGNIQFVSNGTYPWAVVNEGGRSYARNGNSGVHSSTSELSATVMAGAGDMLTFDFKAWGEGTGTFWDHCDFYVDGQRVMYYGAYNNEEWETFLYSLTAGEHELKWSFTKDSTDNGAGDYFYVDNVAIAQAVEVESISAPDRLEIMQYSAVLIEYAVLPANATVKTVTFTSADTSIATVDQNGMVRGVGIGNTVVTIASTADPTITAEVAIKVIESDVEAVTIYGDIVYDPDQVIANQWVTFLDINPTALTTVGAAPDTYGAAYAYGTIYGYTNTDGCFFAIPFDDLANSADYVGSTQMTDLVIRSMSVDYTAGVLYGIATSNNDFCLVAIDMDSGAAETIGNLGVTMLAFAIDINGVAYGIASNGNLYTIDLETAAITLVGSTGQSVSYVQDMAFDYDTGILYWAHSNDTDGDLYVVDPTDASCYKIGNIGPGAGCEVVGMFIVPEIEPERPGDIAVTGVSIIPAQAEIRIDETAEFTAAVLPVNASNKNVTWSVDDPAIISVDGNGVVTGIGAGTAHVIVTTEDGAFTASAEVTVLPPLGELAFGFYFETDPEADGWTFIDNDGDGYSFFWSSNYGSDYSSIAYEGSGYLMSESFVNDFENDTGYAVTPDNWAVSPAVTLPTGSATLIFYATSIGSYGYEHLEVYVGATPDIAAMNVVMADTAVDYNTSGDANYGRYEVDLTAYVGQTVYIAFNHANCSDIFILGIDMVEIYGNEEEVPPAGLPGDVNCDGIVDSADLTLAAAYAMSAGTVSEQGVINGDMNGDGLLTAADLSALYSFIQG